MFPSCFYMQLLEKVGLKEIYESTLWGYLSTTICQTVAVYQVEPKQTPISAFSPCTPFSGEKLGALLIKAVEGLTPTQVCSITK